MKHIEAPKGMIVDLITPLSENGDLDIKGLDAILNRLLPHCSAILLSGPNMGEGRALKEDIRRKLFERALTSVQEKIPLFFWITEKTTENVEALLASLEDTIHSFRYEGQIFWVDSPLYYHSNRDLADYYGSLVSKTRYPFILYNDPDLIKLLHKSLKRNNIRTNIIKDLCKIDHIKALIFKGSLARVHNYQKSLSSVAGFRIYDGNEIRFLDHPSMNGVLSMGANIAPGLWNSVVRSSIGSLQDDDRVDYNINQMLKSGALLRDLFKMYKKNPVWVMKNTLFDLKLIASPTCASAVEMIDEQQTLTSFLLEHSIA
jgi:dihydrodipicolinate synthase/N-acetylneuraminate lyase